MQDEHQQKTEKVVNMAPKLAQLGGHLGPKVGGKSVSRCTQQTHKKWVEKSDAVLCSAMQKWGVLYFN